jgi:hypothetical protein
MSDACVEQLHGVYGSGGALCTLALRLVHLEAVQQREQVHGGLRLGRRGVHGLGAPGGLVRHGASNGAAPPVKPLIVSESLHRPCGRRQNTRCGSPYRPCTHRHGLVGMTHRCTRGASYLRRERLGLSGVDVRDG